MDNNLIKAHFVQQACWNVIYEVYRNASNVCASLSSNRTELEKLGQVFDVDLSSLPEDLSDFPDNYPEVQELMHKMIGAIYAEMGWEVDPDSGAFQPVDRELKYVRGAPPAVFEHMHRDFDDIADEFKVLKPV